MNHNSLKSAEEIELMVGDYRRLVLFTCVACVARSGVGGAYGMKQMHNLLAGIGKEITLEKTAVAACIETMAVPFVRRHANKIAEADAVVALTCTGGMKMFTGLIPYRPVLCPVDMVGSKMIQLNPLVRDSYTDLVVNGNCVCCEHCVMAYTGGICPVTACPLGEKALYGPCAEAPEDGSDRRCVIDPDLDCAWVEIRRRGWNLESLEGLRGIHEKDYPRVTDFGGEYAKKPAPQWLRGTIGWLGARLPAGAASKLAQYTF
jgi:hypothetical protein